ncbi:MAG: class I SAM-dependent methyltransferase [Alphaproteobacteria bacterium]|nr:class I SAM-dependent methyltransferase [Alphaproteobacteria bacterium]
MPSSPRLPALAPGLHAVLALPRADQPEALRDLRRALQAAGAPTPEAWNSRFGTGSLFDAWTRSSLVEGLHRANGEVLREVLPRDRPFRLLEIGGGDGRLWERVLPEDAEGVLTMVDPVPEVADQVRARLPRGVSLDFRPGRAEALAPGSLPDVDAVVCSLTLHHVAGRDMAERRVHGLLGPGKAEVLRSLAAAAKGGLILVNEADVHCEIDLPPGDPVLEERMLDSYVRRCALALLDDVAVRADADDDLRGRWERVVLHWCIEQLDLAAVPLPDRDVYELDAPRWRALFRRADLSLVREVPTDRYGLFRQYLLRP